MIANRRMSEVKHEQLNLSSILWSSLTGLCVGFKNEGAEFVGFQSFSQTDCESK